jgi:hypothetical protein
MARQDDSLDPKVLSLASRVVQSNHTEEDDDDALFAELEAEIENDDSAVMREAGLAHLRSQ